MRSEEPCKGFLACQHVASLIREWWLGHADSGISKLHTPKGLLEEDDLVVALMQHPLQQQRLGVAVAVLDQACGLLTQRLRCRV